MLSVECPVAQPYALLFTYDKVSVMVRLFDSSHARTLQRANVRTLPLNCNVGWNLA